MKLLRAALAAFFVLFVGAPALADNLIIWPYAANPPSAWLNQMERYQRLNDGTFRAAILGKNGTYYNLKIVPTSGLNVQVTIASSTSTGALFQYVADDASGFGGGGPINASPELSADPTQILAQAITTGALAAIGPLSVPGSNSQISLIECQISKVDTTSSSANFINAFGSIIPGTVNRDRNEIIVCQAKAGTAAPVPTVPSADTGWNGIGYVTIPSGTSTITTGMITMLPGIGSIVTADASGNVTIAGTLTASSVPLQFSNTAGSSSSTYIRADGTLAVRGVVNTVFGVQSAPIGSAEITLDASGNVGIAGTIYAGSVNGSGTSNFGPNLKLTLDDDGTSAYVKSPASLYFYTNTSGTAKVSQSDTSGNWKIPGYLAASTAAPTCGSTLPCIKSISCSLSSATSCVATGAVPSGAWCSLNWSASSSIGGVAFEIDTVGVSSTTLSATARSVTGSSATGTASMTALCS